MTVTRTTATALVVAGLLVPAAARAQRDTTVVAGAHYAKSGTYRLFFGSGYRDLWTAPVRVPVLDLATYAGGLTPTTAGGGFQTKSLRFRGADGYQYGFRSVDKAPGVLPAEIESTFVREIVQDEISAGHPGAPAVTGPLMEAAGIPHTEELLVVLPDDPALGQFRERFAGTVGFLSRRMIVEPGRPGFAGALEIINSRALFPRLRAGPDDHIDQRALLAARLFDVFLGDWDRHRGQWTWARFAAAPPYRWTPIPEDRDQAFVRFDGVLLAIARASGAPFLVKFGEDYADPAGQTWNGRDLDRWFLGELDRAAWDSVVAALQSRLTDSVIDAAVRRLPAEWYALNGAWLAATLRARRDDLPEEAARWYQMLAREAEVHGTAADEDLALVRENDGRLTINVTRRGAAQPYFTRRYDGGETEEVRVFTRGGADRVVVRGAGPARIPVRLVAESLVTVADSARHAGLERYDAGWVPVAEARPVRLSTVPPRPGTGQEEPVPPREWGGRSQPTALVGMGPDAGVFIGAGLTRTRYGFRRFPWASQWQLRGGYAFGASKGRIELDGVIRPEQSRRRLELGMHASGVEVLRWFGTGNTTTAPQPDDYYLVNQAEVGGYARLAFPVARSAEFRAGPVFRYSHTREQPGRIIADSLPYGSGDFGQAGIQLELSLERQCCWRPFVRHGTDGDSIGTDSVFGPARSLRLTMGYSLYPKLWDVDSTFSELHAEISGSLTARHAPFRPTLAVRAGGKHVNGAYPFPEAAFIGDHHTVRLGRKNRYAGDAAAWGNAELRLALTRFFMLLPGELGVFGLADAGRVFVSGETSSQWHSAVGGGVWISLLQPANLFSVAVASSRERTAVYIAAGFAY